MTITTPVSFKNSLKALWKRSLIWRWSAIAAILVTILFIWALESQTQFVHKAPPLPLQASYIPSTKPLPPVQESTTPSIPAVPSAKTVADLDMGGILKCAEEKDLRSVSATKLINVKFQNESGSPVKLYWLTYDGSRKFYSTIENGKADVRVTYATHPWVITNSNDQCLEIVISGSATENVIIKSAVATSALQAAMPIRPIVPVTPTSQAKPISMPTVSTPAPNTPKTATLALTTPSNNNAASDDTTGVDSALLGRLYSGSIQVNGFKIPLPEGNWAMFSAINTHSTDDPDSVILTYYLGRVLHTRLNGVVVVNALRSKNIPMDQLVKKPPCENPLAIVNISEPSNSSNLKSCILVHGVFTPPWQQWADRSNKLNVANRAAAGNMQAKGITYPQDFVSVQLIGMDKWKVVLVSYMFSPESEGITSSTVPTYIDSDWNISNINRYPEKLAYVEKLKVWAMGMWPKFSSAFSEAQ